MSRLQDLPVDAVLAIAAAATLNDIELPVDLQAEMQSRGIGQDLLDETVSFIRTVDRAEEEILAALYGSDLERGEEGDAQLLLALPDLT